MRLFLALLLLSLAHSIGAQGEPTCCEMPRWVNTPKPIYPVRSMQLGEQGWVLLKVRLLTDGSIGEIVVHQSSGYKRLDEAALRAAQASRFTPLIGPDGKAVEARAVLPFVFQSELLSWNSADHPELEVLMQQPCSRLTEEAARHLAAIPDADIASMPSFVDTARQLRLLWPEAANVHARAIEALPVAFKVVLSSCAGKPIASYKSQLEQALQSIANRPPPMRILPERE